MDGAFWFGGCECLVLVLDVVHVHGKYPPQQQQQQHPHRQGLLCVDALIGIHSMRETKEVPGTK